MFIGVHLDSIEYIARLLYSAVKKATVSPEHLDVGDYIVVTGKHSDVAGIVNDLFSEGAVTCVRLETPKGFRVVRASKDNFIHIIRKAGEKLKLYDHREYERELKDMISEDHQYSGRPEHGPEISSEKSNLPASKISLSLRPKTKDSKQ